MKVVLPCFILSCFLSLAANAHICEGEYEFESGPQDCNKEIRSVKLLNSSNGKSALFFNTTETEFDESYLDVDSVLASDASLDDDELQFRGKIRSSGGYFRTFTDTGGVPRSSKKVVSCNRGSLSVKNRFTEYLSLLGILVPIGSDDSTCTYRRIN